MIFETSEQHPPWLPRRSHPTSLSLPQVRWVGRENLGIFSRKADAKMRTGKKDYLEKPRKVPFFWATVAGFRGKVDGN